MNFDRAIRIIVQLTGAFFMLIGLLSVALAIWIFTGSDDLFGAQAVFVAIVTLLTALVILVTGALVLLVALPRPNRVR